MKNTILYILAFGVMTLACVGQCDARTASDFFKTAPDKTIRLLSQNTRLDMIDYYNFGSTHTSSNSLQGSAQMKSLSDNSMSFDIDKDVNMQIVVLPTKTDTVIAVVTTLSSPVPDSSIEFYNTSWQPIRKVPFAMPAYSDWLTKEGASDPVTVNLYLPFIPVYATFDPEGKTLLLVNQARKYLDKDDYAKVEPKVIATKMYDVVQGQFRLHK